MLKQGQIVRARDEIKDDDGTIARAGTIGEVVGAFESPMPDGDAIVQGGPQRTNRTWVRAEQVRIFCCHQRADLDNTFDVVLHQQEDGSFDLWATVLPHKSTRQYYGFAAAGIKFCPFCGTKIAQDNDSEQLAEPSVDCYGSGS